MVILQVVWHSIHRKIRFILVEEYPLHRVKDLLSELRLEHVVVLGFHMYNELNVVCFCALGYSLDGSDWDLSLNLILFDVIKSQIGEEKSPVLLHAPPVYLNNNAGEDNFLSLSSVQLRHDFCVARTG